MSRFTTAALLLSLSLLPTACLQQQLQQQQQAEAQQEVKPRALPPLHLGSVHQVYPEQGFALLRIIGPMPGPGTTLITHPANGSNERIGNLSISSQQPTRDGIIAADIRSGTVVKGDRVFRYRNVAASSSSGDIIAEERPTGLAPDEQEVAPIPPPVIAEETPFPAAAETAPAVETTVLPTTAPVAPGSAPDAPRAPAQAPDYLKSIPDSIDDWDSM